jgi:glycolate oxidase
MTVLPHAVVLPKTTEEVLKIVKICNRYDVPYVPYSTGFYGPRTHCHVENELLIDMKRLNDFEIDEKHYYYNVGTGVTLATCQQEALNHGAYAVIGGGGAQCSAICNLIGDGWSPLSHRVGLPHRRILGTELVLPDGEFVRLGSLAVSDDPFWGEGPGPDLRGLLRGFTGLRGCLGIVTKMAIKTLPFQPEPLVPQGVAPNTSLALPIKRVRWQNYLVPTKAAQVQAMLEIGHAEIAAAVTKVPKFWRAIAKAEDKEEFWKLWLVETEESLRNFFIVRVLLVGYTSEEDMQYQEKVLDDIMTELGGTATRTKPSDESWIKNADSAGMWLMCGSYVSVDYIIESMSQAVQHGETYAELKRKYTPPLMPDFGDPGWFQNFEMGHQGYSEFLIYWDHREDIKGVDQFYVDSSKMNGLYVPAQNDGNLFPDFFLRQISIFHDDVFDHRFQHMNQGSHHRDIVVRILQIRLQDLIVPGKDGLFPFIHEPHQFLITVKGQINLDSEPVNLFVMAAQGIQIIYELSIKIFDVVHV